MEKNKQKPNILLITSDQQHWNTLGVTNPQIQTPNLDKLAAQGTIFSRAYCSNPTCTPARASMITGKYPSQHGAWALGTKLPESEQTIGDILQQNGYCTALVGKAHFQPLKGTDEFPSLESYPIMQDLDFWRRFSGPFYGFHHVELARNHVDEAHVGQHYALWMEKKGCSNWRDYFCEPTGNAKRGQLRHKWPIPEEFHYDTWIAERTNALLEKFHKNNQPFFLWASFFDPHPSYLVPEPWDTMYDSEKLTISSVVEGEHKNNPPHFKFTQQKNPDFSAWKESGQSLHGFCSHLIDRGALAKNVAIYYAMISLMDKYIGKILDNLEQLKLADNTIVLFATDHGHFIGQHGLITKGAFHYEDLIKIPLIVRYPDKIPAGRKSDALQSQVDLPLTFLSFAGIDIPRTMTGVDQKEVWLGTKEKVRDHVIVENRLEPTTIHVKTYLNERYKITVYYNQPYGELFDLKEDPQEIKNLWYDEGHLQLKQELLLKLIHAEMGKEPLWMPRIATA